MPAQPSVASQLRATLIDRASPTGGWPYYAGKSSRIEPTCWALLALADTSGDDPDRGQAFAAPHLQWLAKVQGRGGLLIDVPDAPANFTANGLAACVLSHLLVASGFSRTSAGPLLDLPRLVDAIVAAKGVSVDAPDPRQNNTLQGWPWMPDTFSWLEPTCWCVLALKKAGGRIAGTAARTAEAEKLIVNRTCESGGWNFGNASVIGQDLRPYVPTTALALIALQDRQESPEVARSARWLREARLKEPSAMALALTAIWFRIAGTPADDVEARLAADLDRAQRLGNLQTLAMALFALTMDRHSAKAFRVQ